VGGEPRGLRQSIRLQGINPRVNAKDQKKGRCLLVRGEKKKNRRASEKSTREHEKALPKNSPAHVEGLAGVGENKTKK